MQKQILLYVRIMRIKSDVTEGRVITFMFNEACVHETNR